MPISHDEVETKLIRFYEARPLFREFNDGHCSLAIGLVKEAVEVLELEQFGRASPGRISSEIGDVMIYLLQIARKYGVDIWQATFEKIETNEARFPAGFFVEGSFEEQYIRVKASNGERRIL